MKRLPTRKILAISATIFLCLGLDRVAYAGNPKPTKRQIAAVVQAVEDEIYDWGFEKDFINIGTTGAINSPTGVRLYIFPTLDRKGSGSVMYKLMPFGEVVRRFAFRPDGMAVLWGNPLNGFPASQPDTRTIYVDDDWVCNFKRKAIRAYFTVDPDVPLSRREAAARRQLIRIGRSRFFATRGGNENHQKSSQ